LRNARGLLILLQCARSRCPTRNIRCRLYSKRRAKSCPRVERGLSRCNSSFKAQPSSVIPAKEHICIRVASASACFGQRHDNKPAYVPQLDDLHWRVQHHVWQICTAPLQLMFSRSFTHDYVQSFYRFVIIEYPSPNLASRSHRYRRNFTVSLWALYLSIS